jgi:hypothetical protein
MEDDGLWEIAHDTGNESIQDEFWVNMVRWELRISCVAVTITAHSILVVIPPAVLVVKMDMNSKFILWTLARHQQNVFLSLEASKHV